MLAVALIDDSIIIFAACQCNSLIDMNSRGINLFDIVFQTNSPLPLWHGCCAEGLVCCKVHNRAIHPGS